MVSNIENNFSKVIAELSRIDDVAEKVLINNEADKQAYSEKINKESAKFDKELEESTRKKISDYTDKTSLDLNNSLDLIRKETKQAIDDLETWYKKNHTLVAKEIVAEFIKEWLFWTNYSLIAVLLPR